MIARSTNSNGRLRVGAVSYLNARPLVRHLAGALPDAAISYDTPRRLADLLAAGELDVALAPCICLADHPEWSLLSTACIGARGPVESVKLLFCCPPAEVRSLALDEGSRSSVVLAQLLLAEKFGVRPRLLPLPLGEGADSTDADAVLMIGDRAMGPPPARFSDWWDLGAEWRQWTGLPMVFAMWMARPGVDGTLLADAFDTARDAGLRDVEAIAAEAAIEMQLPEDFVLRYLQQHLYYRFGPNERRGLEEFFRRAARLGLIASDHLSTPVAR